MATWLIRRDRGNSILTYLNDGELPQDCGHIASQAERDLVGWVGQQAQPYDLISTPRGVFVRQNHVSKGSLASA